MIFFSDNSTFTLSWLRNLVAVTLLGWLFWLVLYVLDFTINYFNSYNGAEAYYPLYIYMSIFIYWIGYSGFIHQAYEPLQLIDNKFERSKELSNVEQNQLKQLIKKVHDEKIYTRISLKIDELANSLDLKTAQISFLIKNGLNKNFYDFINELRINEFKQKLESPTNNHLTIQSLAEDSGFKSRSTYNDLFKKYVGLTPNEYKIKQQS